MIQIIAKVNGRGFAGALHIKNDGKHPKHPDKGFYDAICYDKYGSKAWDVQKVEHNRDDDWLTLVKKVLEAR